MSYNLGIILSMTFVIMFYIFGADIMSIQYIYSELDSKAISFSYHIAKNGNLNEIFIKNLETYYNVSFLCLSNCTPKFGDIVEYTLSTVYDPLIISSEQMKISIKRSTVIGYYD